MEDTNTNILNAKTGNEEQPTNTVAPAKVKIASVVIQTKNQKGETMQTPLAKFMVKHPDKDELINITKIKYIDGKEILTKGFWIQQDEDGNFYKGSTIDLILKYLDCETLEDTYGKEIDTIEESKDSSYLCLKAY